MSAERERAAASETKTASGAALLEQMIGETVKRGVEKKQARSLIDTLIDEALSESSTIVWKRNVTQTLKEAIAAIDEQLSRQLAAVMHHEKFQRLEGSWRGLKYLIANSELGSDSNMYVDVLNIKKREVQKDLEKASDFDQSELFKKIYESEFGMPGGEPYAALIGDYDFSAHPEDVELLKNLSGIASAAFCPFLSAASPQLFGFKSFTELPGPRDLKGIFKSAVHTAWRSFRESDDSRFVVLTMPRVLARLPYGKNTKSVDEFEFEEAPFDPKKAQLTEVPHDTYCWMNAAYVLATKMTDAFAKTGFCTQIRGKEGGGKVEDLPVHHFLTDDGDLDLNCPTEIAITDRREKELSDSGFLPLSHYKNTDYSVFFGAQTTQKPQHYDNDNATANAEICARLPYVMASSRFAHYLKVIGRDKVGSLLEAGDVEKFLKQWIAQYVLQDERPSPSQKARFPLKAAQIEVKEDPRNPGSYSAIAYLQPWLHMEELNTSVRMVARIPKKK